MANVQFTEDQAEIVLLALEYFRRYHMHEYDEGSRKEVMQLALRAEDKVRSA